MGDGTPGNFVSDGDFGNRRIWRTHHGLDEFSQTRISHQVAHALAEFGFCDTNISWATDIFIDKLCH
jgi:hypothetical protein